ncbi:translation initiation factor IF-2 [Desulfofundulus luciae]|uniref:Translation initiation factor IF-2 n=1 Tax=Desulfofundulus luciae TaxID=74702 RepID=A0ABU0B1N8_9FIRM|nr:translation initiation factor IF-2 [Desulfofundulus luciae]MDQ0286649.1 translation initiation factor IF-2 [Desulfofundulus luciae]
MVKKRVHELAKELNVESKELMQKLSNMGISVKSPLSTLQDAEVERVLAELKGGNEKVVNNKGGNQQAQATAVQAQARADKAKEGKNNHKKRHAERPRHQQDARRYDRGPGLVDRVPSRPPDRRFQERPLKVEPPQPQPRAQAQQPASKVQQPAARGRMPAEKKAQVAPPQGEATGRQPAKTKPEHLKVPKVPQEIKAVSEKVRSDKTRGEKKQEKQHTARARDRKELLDETLVDRKLRPLASQKKKTAPGEPEPKPVVEKKPIVIGESITVKELAEKMKNSPAEVIKKLMMLGVLATINQEIDADTATILAQEFGFEVEVKVEQDVEALFMQEPEDDPADLQPRPCVVTVMGHVDHGKTSLLDAIRETNVTATEAGGITQHIGAYQVEHNNKKITFLDTPGHEAFTAMRARGAKVTDIAILVVAADDGVMPQTVEAINHAKAAGVPIIVAINKIDRPDANPDRVKQQLTEYGLVAEEWGGETVMVPVSAKTRQGLEDLLEMILLVAEMQELKANPNRPARGTVIEAELDKGRGPVATVLVQNGTLTVGDNLVAGTTWARVRAMMDYKGRRVKKAGPSTPVEVLGFSEVPQAGDQFFVVPDEKTARQIAEKRANRKREEEFKAAMPRVSLDDLFNQIKEGQVKELRVIIKADVQGSAEALKQALERLSTEEVKVNIIHQGVGAITETDIMLASASNAIIIGFNVRPDVNARRVAEKEKVDIRLYRVIYDAIEDVKAAMSGLLEPEYREVILGRAEVRKTFKISKVGTIAGCYVTDGKIARDAGVRVIRDGVVVYEGKLGSLKRFKDDVREVMQGYECGLALEKYNEIREGDIIEAFTMEAVKRELA